MTKIIIIAVLVYSLQAGILIMTFTAAGIIKGGGIDTDVVTTISEDDFTLETKYDQQLAQWDYTVKTTFPYGCYGASVDAIVAESFPEQVTIAVSVFGPGPDTACAAVEVPFEYSGQVKVSSGATFRLRVIELQDGILRN